MRSAMPLNLYDVFPGGLALDHMEIPFSDFWVGSQKFVYIFLWACLIETWVNRKKKMKCGEKL